MSAAVPAMNPSTDPVSTRIAVRVVRPGGRVVVLESPFYWHRDALPGLPFIDDSARGAEAA